MDVGMNTCRVCFEKKQRSCCSINIDDICCHKLTIKEAIIQLVPEMAQTLVNDDYICKICLKSLRFCIRFIEKCRYIQLEFVGNENRFHRDLDAFPDGQGETFKNGTAQRDEAPRTCDGNHENTNSKDEAHCVDHNYSVTLDPKRFEPIRTLHDAANIEEHDKILSVEQPRGAVIPEFLDSLRAGGVKVLQYVGADVTLPKRVLLLGSTVRPECPECGAQFLTETALNSHTSRVHEAEAAKQGSALCDKDGNKLGEADKLAVAKKSLKCAKCTETFASFGEYRRHVQQCQWRRCPHCGLALDRRQFRKHVLTVHGDDRPFKCRQCGKSYKKYSTYSSHSRGHKEYACGVCGRVYKVKVSLQRHKERCGANGAAVDKSWSSGVKVCGTCGLEFIDGKQFLKHKQTHARMVCDVCGKCFNGTASLRVHILSHNSYDSAICDACGKGFKTRCALNHHLRTHYSARQQACDRCPKRFLFRNALLAHIKRAHDKLKDVACDACDKTFHTKSMMQYHYRAVHLKVRPFKCPICEREFSRKLNMQTHMRVHDKEKQVTGKIGSSLDSYIQELGQALGSIENLSETLKTNLYFELQNNYLHQSDAAPEKPENTGTDTEIDQTAQVML